MKVITLINNKGGVGKTTSSQNIGAGLAHFGENKILMIDLDSQANLTRCFGIRQEDIKEDIGNFIMGESSFEEIVIEVSNNLFLLPSSPNLIAKEDSIKTSPTYPFNFKIALSKIPQDFDFVIVDCPPALSGLTRIAIVGCDAYFVPLQAEFLSYEGLRNLLDFAEQMKQISPDINLGGIFATRYNPNVKKRIANDLMEATKESLGNSLMKTYIRENIALSECQANGQDIFDYNEESNGAKDYYELIKEIISKL